MNLSHLDEHERIALIAGGSAVLGLVLFFAMGKQSPAAAGGCHGSMTLNSAGQYVPPGGCQCCQAYADPSGAEYWATCCPPGVTGCPPGQLPCGLSGTTSSGSRWLGKGTTLCYCLADPGGVVPYDPLHLCDCFPGVGCLGLPSPCGIA